MQKIVINTAYGGFGLSDKTIERLKELGYDKKEIEEDIIPEGILHDHPFKYWGLFDIKRDSPLLIQIVEEIGKDANHRNVNLKIVEIPDDVEWQIEEAEDGTEWVAEKHRVWGVKKIMSYKTKGKCHINLEGNVDI